MTLLIKLLSSLFFLIVSALGAGALAVIGAALYFAPGLPDVRQLEDIRLHAPLRIYTRDGSLIGEFGQERRTPIEYDDIPQSMIDALMAAEDQHFFDHYGVDPRGLARAAVELVGSGSIQSGGSTITMQVARNYLLTLDQTFTRKIREILLALQMEQVLDKQEIMELYVNKIFLGNRAYGIASAAETYYDKPLDQLNLAQVAMIAGLPKAPSSFNPLANSERALIRRNWILYRMRLLGMIDETAYQGAVQAPISAENHITQPDINAAYMAEMARQYALESFGEDAYTGGYRIYTTLDSELQPMASRALRDGLIEYDRRHGWRGPEKSGIPASLVDAQEQAGTAGLEQELTESPEIRTTARQAAARSEARVDGIEGDISNWLQVLGRTPTYGPLLPAIVVKADGQKMEVVTADRQRHILDWTDLEWAEPYLSPRSRGAAPSSASQIASRGDLVRVIEDSDGSLHLSQRPAAEGALVVQSSTDGAILALQGGFDFDASSFNRAVQARRQAGSIFKPFIYAAALEEGDFTAASIVNDAPVVEDDGSDELWRPVNSNLQFMGPMRIRPALARSRNLVTIRVLKKLGLDNTRTYLERFGFNRDELPDGLSLALGSADLTPLQMNNAYAILANGGYRVTPWYIDRVTQGLEGDTTLTKITPVTVCKVCEDDQTTVTIDDRTRPIAPRVADEEAVYIVNDMLRDVIQRGTGAGAKSLGRSDIAGKTGTTNGRRDAWFAGFNPSLVATAWVGKDDNESIAEYGSQAALPIWTGFMEAALKGTPDVPQERPPGVISTQIDPDSGLRLRDGEPGGIIEVFDAEHLPDFQPIQPRNLNQELEKSSGAEGTASPESIF